ncbi:hypothetical protein BG262_08800 [Floricoccus penangensis]|uniref:HTH cro/C1-type domain-containing protein n=1 Tax=Floricoccus penangensis TaxID=1859475 RepID=A0A9Q5JHP6_9LACT|nr:helix-turn-helix domain-containing protein [Floricoccus penangensis]OFI47780.1 hypothetical protein BG262_08800 [Floricoccus penangensis]
MNKKEIGNIIKRKRIELGLSQKQCAYGICSQPLLSNIEAGNYMPSGDILLKLLSRLGIANLQDISLNEFLPLSSDFKMNEKCELLCRNHEYSRLNNFLLSTDVIESVSELNMQNYYYYLAVSQFQIGNLKEAQQNFNIVLIENNKNIVERLCNSGLGLISAKLGLKKESEDYFCKSFFDLDKIKYEENMNVLFYLKALAQKTLNMYSDSFETIEEAIKFISSHNSHYMLANLYYLAVSITNNKIKKIEYSTNSDLFRNLYKEEVFKKI